MKISIGYGDETYGAVEGTSKGLVYSGEKSDLVKNLIESFQEMLPEKTDEQLLQFALGHLRSRTWAKKIE